MDQESLALIAFLVLAGLGGAYLTALLCRKARQRVGWFRALVGAISSGLLTSIFVWLGLSLTHGDSPFGLLLWAFMWACGCAFIPAVLAVWYYRRKVGHAVD